MPLDVFNINFHLDIKILRQVCCTLKNIFRPSGSAIKCYHCDSTVDESCNDVKKSSLETIVSIIFVISLLKAVSTNSIRRGFYEYKR